MTIRDIASVLEGVRRVARLDAQGVRVFDASIDGFWRSFWAAVILAPLAGVTVLLEARSIEEGGEATRFILLQACAYVTNWVAFPLLMLRITAFLQRGHNYLRYIVAYNWFRLIEALIVYPLALLAATELVPVDAIAFFGLMAISLMLLYDWFIAKSALEVEGGTAAAIVLIGFLLSYLINGLALKLV
jgi:hypothetical protein